MKRPGSRLGAFVLTLAALGSIAAVSPATRAKPTSVAVPGASGVVVRITGGRHIALVVTTARTTPVSTAIVRYCRAGTTPADLERARSEYGRLAPGPEAERSADHSSAASGALLFPFGLLSLEWRGRALQALFPADGATSGGWLHRPGRSPAATYGEGAWDVALWFTGSGESFEAIMEANGLTDPLIAANAEILVPTALLAEPFRAASSRMADSTVRGPSGNEGVSGGQAPATSPNDDEAALPVPSAAQRAARAQLTFGEDKDGEYASYRLKSGEALYSAVVLRYTGRVDPQDVSEAAATIARRSGIANVMTIPVGTTIKIPLSLLLPEFLPLGDDRRQDIDATQRETAKVKAPARSRNLEGVHVILDAGHGGVDPGALVDGLAEHEYAYDVLCRVKKILETETSAIVHPVIEDPVSTWTPRSGRILPIGGGETILTTPPYVNDEPGETSLGVHLRWILANAIERRLARSGVDSSRIVFASFHADVLHPSLRGAMIYVPGERFRRGVQSCNDPAGSRYLEVREKPRVQFSRQERIASEGLSRRLAGNLVRSLGARRIAVHPYEPVRDRIIRSGREWLPAVLRGNAVPAKLLIEIANLNNGADRRRLQDPAFREAFAHAFVDALGSYFRASSGKKLK